MIQEQKFTIRKTCLQDYAAQQRIGLKTGKMSTLSQATGLYWAPWRTISADNTSCAPLNRFEQAWHNVTTIKRVLLIQADFMIYRLVYA